MCLITMMWEDRRKFELCMEAWEREKALKGMDDNRLLWHEDEDDPEDEEEPSDFPEEGDEGDVEEKVCTKSSLV